MQSQMRGAARLAQCAGAEFVGIEPEALVPELLLLSL